MTLRRELLEAIKDYRYLLDRGYPQKPSLDLVSTRYMLDHRERMLLYRCIHPHTIAEDVRRKLVKPYDLVGEELVLDFYNVALTVVAALRGEEVYLCDDGVVRDLRGSKLRSGEEPYFIQSLEIIAQTLAELRVRLVHIVAESSVSHSAEHVAYAKKLLASRGLQCRAYLVRQVDSTVIDLSNRGVVSSSDIVVLTRVQRVFDLAGYIVMRNSALSRNLVVVSPTTQSILSG